MSEEIPANIESKNVTASNVVAIVQIDTYYGEEKWSKKVQFPQTYVHEKEILQDNIHVQKPKCVPFCENVAD
jgi:hypothetical protein